VNEEFQKSLKQNGINNTENPTESDMKKYVAMALPYLLSTVKDLAAQNLGKYAIRSYNKRIDALNKRYETEKDPEELKRIWQETSEIYDRIEKESDKQRDWLTKIVFGVGTAVVLGFGIKNKEAGKKIVEEGIKVIKG